MCEMEGKHVCVGWRGSMYMWDGEGSVGVCVMGGTMCVWDGGGACVSVG